MKVFLLPYNTGSAGAKTIADTLGIRRIKLANSKFVPSNKKLVINWGNSSPGFNHEVWINAPENVKHASHKARALDAMAMRGVPVLEYTRDVYEALSWLRLDGTVIARKVMQGSRGEGIVIIDREEDLHHNADAPLFTRYFKARDEYRVHVVMGKVVDVQQKRKRADVDNADVNYKVRSHENGFNFCREDVELPDVCSAASIAAVKALGLDFGAVDIRFNNKTGKCAVLEVNTAPGLEGTTIDTYAKAFIELFNNFDVQG